MKFFSGIRAESHEVAATDFVMEPNSYLDCSGQSSSVVSANAASGGGHATPGGSGEWSCDVTSCDVKIDSTCQFICSNC